MYVYIYIYIYYECICTYVYVNDTTCHSLIVSMIQSMSTMRSMTLHATPATDCASQEARQKPLARRRASKAGRGVGECGPGGTTRFRERGSAPKRGRHCTVCVSTKCICAVAVLEGPDVPLP